MTRTPIARCAAALALFAVLLPANRAAGQAAVPTRVDTFALRPGDRVERELPTGAVHAYIITASAGQLLRVETDEPPERFYLRVYGPDGVQLADAWATSNQRTLPFVMPFLADRGGVYRVEVRSPAADFPAQAADFPTARYGLRLGAAPADSAATERARQEAAIAWIAGNAHPLRAVEAGHAMNDLRPLADILRGVRVVGLGEATHGTREFFQVKHRLIEYLVRELGFTVVAMEADEGAAVAIDDFVRHGRGSRAAAVRAAGMWQWDTEEVAAMLDWLRAYNRTVPAARQVRFVGFDFQVNDRGVADVLAYLRRVAPERAAAAESLLAPLVRRPDPARRAVVEFYSLPPARKAAVDSGVKALFDDLAAKRATYVRRTSAAAYADVLRSARRLVQFTDTHRRAGYAQDDPESGVATRDRYMAENVARTLDAAGPGARMVLWSHNEHVRRDPYDMGYHLGQRYGRAYYAFGLSFDRGEFRALEITDRGPVGLKRFTLPPAFAESVGWALRRAEKGDAYVDFRDAPAIGPAAEWLARPHAMRSIGNGYAPMNPSGYLRAPAVLGRSFDGIIFIEQTTAARGATYP